MQPQAAVATRDVLAPVGGAHPPPPRLAVMMDTIVDGSIAIVDRPGTMMTAHQHDTNRPPISRTENEKVVANVVANVVVGNKSHAEIIEVRWDHAREARARKARARKTTAPRIHPTCAPLRKMSAVPRK